jgi:hypothetical protein
VTRRPAIIYVRWLGSSNYYSRRSKLNKTDFLVTPTVTVPTNMAGHGAVPVEGYRRVFVLTVLAEDFAVLCDDNELIR